MNTAQSKAIVERIFNDVMDKRNYSVLDELFAPQFTNHSMPMPQPGPEGFKAILEQFTNAFPDMKITLQHIIGEDNMVATSGYWTGTNKGSFMGMPATGKKVNIPFMDIWRVKDGKAIENWVQMDNAAIMQQLGVMPQNA